MSVLIPLAFALILINHKKIRDDQNYRFSVFSVVGITFFFVLKYVDYYFSIFDHAESFRIVVQLAIVLATVGICLSPLLAKSNHVKAGICISLFVLSIILAFPMERSIKIIIADIGGYFDERERTQSLYSGEVKNYTSKHGGYSLLVPKHWDLKTKNDLEYFVIGDNNSILLEFRPRCFHDTNIVITEVVQGLEKSGAIENRHTTSNCSREGDTHMCLVKIMGSSSIASERWHWLSMNTRTQQNIELDILLFTNNEDIKNQLNSVFNSITIEALEDPKPNCPSPIDWF